MFGFKDNLPKMVGRLTITKNDEVVADIPNLVVTVGKEHTISRLKDTTQAAMSHMALGTGTTAAAIADTALETEAGRIALSSSTVSGASIQYVATFGAGTATGAITEAGIFNDASAGEMLCRTVFSEINKGAQDSVTVTWTVSIT